jgi:hypothetical protein
VNKLALHTDDFVAHAPLIEVKGICKTFATSGDVRVETSTHGEFSPVSKPLANGSFEGKTDVADSRRERANLTLVGPIPNAVFLGLTQINPQKRPAMIILTF